MQTSAQNNSTQVVLLGTGTPNPDPLRMGPCTAITVGERAYIIDCGPGLVRRAQAAYEQGIAALKVSNLTHLFLTHLHSDHTIGLPDIIFTPWVMGRKEPLQVFGPKGTAHLVDHVNKAYGADIQARTCGLEPINSTGGKAEATEFSAGVCYEDSAVRIEAFGVNHGKGWEPFGFKITTNDKTIVVSGDTSPCPDVYDLWKNCDVLVHEVYSQKGFDRRNPDWQRYHSAMHTSGIQLGEIAAQVNPKKLVMTHLLLWGATEVDLINEVRQNFQGDVQVGQDLGVY
ncbi:MBL fold metallo-hydrolase [Reinekea marina]|uniref:MBL fold metallo-hydrolase n=2 Tax=Reinekea marina TaxID=1310421 RepID=A0ABV7WVA9_9GAMM